MIVNSTALGEFTKDMRVNRTIYWEFLTQVESERRGKASKGGGEGAASRVRGKQEE